MLNSKRKHYKSVLNEDVNYSQLPSETTLTGSTKKVLKLEAKQMPAALSVKPLISAQSLPIILIIVYSHVANAHIRYHWRTHIGTKNIDARLQLITIFYI